MFWDSWLFPFLHCIRLSLLFYLQFALDALCVTQLCILAHFFLALASPLVFYLLSYCLISVGSHVLFFSLTTLHAVILPGILIYTSLLLIGFLWRVQGHQLTLSTMMFLSLFQYAILMSALVWGSAEMDLFRCFCGLYATSVSCFLMLSLLQSSVVGRMGELCVVVCLGVMAVGLPPVRYGLAKWKVMAEVHKVAFGAVVMGVGLSWCVCVMQVLLFLVPLLLSLVAGFIWAALRSLYGWRCLGVLERNNNIINNNVAG